MSIDQILALALSVIDTLGARNIVLAGLVIALVGGFVSAFFRR